MDFSDTATKREEEFLAHALAKAQLAIENSKSQPSDDCIDCGEVIPEDRKEAQPYCCRCVDCQNAREGIKK